MNKKIINIVLALTLVVAGMTVVKVDADAAADKNCEWGVTYQNKQFNPMPGKEYSESIAYISDAVPGDTIEYNVFYQNLATDKDGKGEETNFYLNTKVAKSLEDTSTAQGGAYTFKILNNGEVLFDSETGGDAQSAEGKVGLNLVNGNQGTYFSLGTLSYNETGTVTVSIKLDGNSQTNAYMDQLAKLNLVFVAEPAEELIERKTLVDKIVKKETKVEHKYASDKKTIVKEVVKTLDNGTEIVAIDDSDVPLAGSNPQTGDSMLPMVLCSIMFVIGMFLICWYASICVNNKQKGGILK